MFDLFKRKSKPGSTQIGSLQLCSDGYCAVVGESHYQEALRATIAICTPNFEGRPAFTATLVAEPDNPYDANAIAVHSPKGKVGYLSRETAVDYGQVFAELAGLGHHGGTCNAFLTGGEPGKPSLGVVLHLADPRRCLAELRGEEHHAEEFDHDRDSESGWLQAEDQPVITLEFQIGSERSLLRTPVDLRGERPRRREADALPDECWRPAGTQAMVAGRRLDGLVYVGRDLAPADNQSYWFDVEPALIDPALPVAEHPKRLDSPTLWPLAYEQLSPDHRAAYLDWLSTGRNDPDVAPAYLELFVAGLERRALVDARRSETTSTDLAPIVNELERLLQCYGDVPQRVQSFVDVLRIESLESDAMIAATPPWERKGWEAPIELRIGLGTFARSGRRLPAEWALSWARCSPEAWLRTPAHRCPDEFKTLFMLRYGEHHGEGLTLKNLKKRLTVEHRPINQGMRDLVKYITDLPDVAAAGHVVNPLRRLAQACTDELDTYSRYLGRHPEAADDLRALALLPGELLERHESDQLNELRELIASLVSQERIVVSADPVIAAFAGDTGKLAKKDAVALVRLLAALGSGVEPDVRFCGEVPASGHPIVLFPLPPDASEAPTPEYAAAAALLHMAVAVAAADQSVSFEEEAALASHLSSAPDLEEHERTRLAAHLEWLLAEPPSLRGIKARVAQVQGAQRERVAGGLLAMAGADGFISPDEVRVLTKLFAAMGLEEALLYRELHAIATTPPTEPITVRRAKPGDPEYSLPTVASREGISLDRKLIEAKLVETAAVSALLAGIFADEEPPRRTPEPEGPLGLDAPHLQFLHRLAERGEWGRAEIESIAAELRLLPDGALEVINDAAFEAADAPVWQGEDPVEIDPVVLARVLP